MQAAFLWGYMATQLVGGALADKYGGKLVMAGGIAWFSVASLLLPAALTPAAAAAGLAVPIVLASRCLVVSERWPGLLLPALRRVVLAALETSLPPPPRPLARLPGVPHVCRWHGRPAHCATRLRALLLGRRTQGLGEGVALPAMNNLIATHIDPKAKARGLGVAFSGFHSGEPPCPRKRGGGGAQSCRPAMPHTPACGSAACQQLVLAHLSYCL